MIAAITKTLRAAVFELVAEIGARTFARILSPVRKLEIENARLRAELDAALEEVRQLRNALAQREEAGKAHSVAWAFSNAVRRAGQS